MWRRDSQNLDDGTYDVAVMRRWLAAVDDAAAISVDLRTISSIEKSSSLNSTSKGEVPEELFLKQGHLFLCFDMAKRLLYSPSSALRAEALNIMK